MRGPVHLRNIDKAKAILQEIRDELISAGLSTASFTLADTGEVIEFDVVEGISVIDHGRTQETVRCVACTVHPQLQYEFIVSDVQGRVHGPIGSTCILQRPLGREQAERYGDRLVAAAREHFRPRPWKLNRGQSPVISPHDQQHRKLLRKASSTREYLRSLGFDWVMLAVLQGDGYVALQPEDRVFVRNVLDQGRYLRQHEYQRLRELTDTREQREAAGQRYVSVEIPVPTPLSRPTIKKIVTPKRRTFAHHDPHEPLGEAEWLLYLQQEGRLYTPAEWTRLAMQMKLADRERLEAKLQSRLVLDWEDKRVIEQAAREGRDHEPPQELSALPRPLPLRVESAVIEVMNLLISDLERHGFEDELWRFKRAEPNMLIWIRAHASKFLGFVQYYEYLHVPDDTLMELVRKMRVTLPTGPK